MGSGSARERSYLLKCPNEILSSILLSCPPADRFRVSLVNKQLNGVANRFLYSTVKFRWTAPRTTNAEVTPSLTIFLRSILGNPQLAAFVQHLCLDGSLYWNLRSCGNLPTISWAGTGSTLDRAVSLVTELSVPYAQDWVRGLEEGTIDALIAFLLTRLPNLRSFATASLFTQEWTLQRAMFHSVVYGQNRVGWLPRFDQLSDVLADFYRDYNILCDSNTDTLLSFFYLPAIQTLDLCLDNPARFSWPAATAPDCTTLTSLTLCHVRESALKEILSSTKQLIKLNWQFLQCDHNLTTENEDDPPLYPPIADLDVIVDALTPVRDTLKDLTIGADAIKRERVSYDISIEVRGSLKGLVEFPKVERFEVPLPFLAGQLVPNNRFRISGQIPQNLRTLVLNSDLRYFAAHIDWAGEWDDGEIALNLRDWLLYEEFESDTPFMEQLELGFLEDRGWGLYCELKRLLDKERVPVKLTVLGEEPEPFDPDYTVLSEPEPEPDPDSDSDSD
ncbi:hypothetical protein PG996_000433 [Apiospora saccharicola]|uniref:F-box domain-containing protein n=1 Tax=Apiospora saccharicola TaxID=335842 RepID=A0ABR1WF46_9PEZI